MYVNDYSYTQISLVIYNKKSTVSVKRSSDSHRKYNKFLIFTYPLNSRFEIAFLIQSQ